MRNRLIKTLMMVSLALTLCGCGTEVPLNIVYSEITSPFEVDDTNSVHIREMDTMEEDDYLDEMKPENRDYSILNNAVLYDSQYAKITTEVLQTEKGEDEIKLYMENKWEKEIKIYFSEFKINGCYVPENSFYGIEVDEVYKRGVSYGGITLDWCNITTVENLTGKIEIKDEETGKLLDETHFCIGEEGLAVRAKIDGGLEYQITKDIRVAILDAYVVDEYDNRHLMLDILIDNNTNKDYGYEVKVISIDGEEGSYLGNDRVLARCTKVDDVRIIPDNNHNFTEIKFSVEIFKLEGEDKVIGATDIITLLTN